METDVLNFENLGNVLDDEEVAENKFEKFGAYHKTNVVFLLDLTHDMLVPSGFREQPSGNAVSLAYACAVAIRQAIVDMIKHSSLGGGGRDRVAILGLLHKKKTVVLLSMQLPSAETLKTVDHLLDSLRQAPVKEGSTIDLGKAFDMAFTLLKDLRGDAQIFVCTANDDPCDRTIHKGVSEEMVVCSKATDLTQNHLMSIKLLAVPRHKDTPFNVGRFWREIIVDQGSENRAVLSNLGELTRHVRALTRPTALTVPNGNNMKLRVHDGRKRGSYVMQVHVNLYALSRSRELNPSKSFHVDVDDGSFLVEARVRNGKIIKGTSDMYAAFHSGGESAEEDDGDAASSTVGEDAHKGKLYVRKKVMKFRDRDMKVWTNEELTALLRHNNPRCVDVMGFIPHDRVNREFRGKSPQYLTLSKGSSEDETSWWSALWHACRRLDAACVAVLWLRETNAPRQVLLSAHPEHRDAQGCLQLPNGFYVHHWPHRDRVYVEVRPPSAASTEPLRTDARLMEALERSLNVITPSLRPGATAVFSPVADRNAERQWRVLEALALDLEPPPPLNNQLDGADSTAEIYPREITHDLETLRAIIHIDDASDTAGTAGKADLVSSSKSKRGKKR